MHLTTRNVNTAFRSLVELFHNGEQNRTEKLYRGINPIVRRPSRYGDTLTLNEPIIVTYTHPRERVLFNPYRDANPFFHLYESLWMLAGRNDVAPLAYYNSRMMEFSDNGHTLNGAYGYRWKKALAGCDYNLEDGEQRHDYRTVDQLDTLVSHLRADPDSRRAVLSMWNVKDDLLKIGGPATFRQLEPGIMVSTAATGENKGSKDVCCNLNVLFSLRPIGHPDLGKVDRVLDMTVTNRSNDLIWGLLGANYVHFTMLQEYMADRLNVEVGRYHHFSNNLHVYTAPGRWDPERWLQEYDGFGLGKHANYHDENQNLLIRLEADSTGFDEELRRFVEFNNGRSAPTESADSFPVWNNPFLQQVASPMCWAFHHYKAKQEGWYERAVEWIDKVESPDWKLAGKKWLNRRTYKQQYGGATTEEA